MLKKFILFFLLLSTFSFSRFVNECRLLSRDFDAYSFRCKSLESGKIFRFYVNSYQNVNFHSVGSVYKVWFYENEYSNYIWQRSISLY